MGRAKRLHRTGLVAVAAAVALVFSGCTSGGSDPDIPAQRPGGFTPEVTQRLESAVTDAMALAGASAGMVGVWAPWAGSWTDGLGTTAIGGGSPVSPDMTFRAGQISTAMTCTVLLSMVDEGKVGLDDQLTEWVPGLVGATDVTLRELCQNTSGIGDYSGQLRVQFLANPTRYWPPLELASDGIATARTGTPGEKYNPSQTNAVLLGMALQNAAGQRWSQLYERYIFERLGMDSSVLPDNGVLTVPGVHPVGYSASIDAAGGWVCEPVRDATRLSPSMGWTAAGVVSSVPDLKAFVQALAAGSLLSERSSEAQARTVPAGASWLGYGLGVLHLGPLRGAASAVPGYVSAAYADPSSGLTIVVALNNSTPGANFAQALAQRLASIVSKVPADQKGLKVVASLPWSEQQAVDAMAASAPCPAPAPVK